MKYALAYCYKQVKAKLTNTVIKFYNKTPGSDR